MFFLEYQWQCNRVLITARLRRLGTANRPANATPASTVFRLVSSTRRPPAQSHCECRSVRLCSGAVNVFAILLCAVLVGGLISVFSFCCCIFAPPPDPSACIVSESESVKFKSQ